MAMTRGRERELRALRAAVEAGTSVLVVGPVGVGKSHVINRFLDDPPRHWYVLHVVASEAAATIPFGAVASLLPAHAADPYALLQSATDRFHRLAVGRRRLVVVDDLHLLDASSTALVHNLCVVHGALLVATARRDMSPAAAVALVKDVGAEHVDLGPLTERDARLLAADGLGCQPDDPTVDPLLVRSGGNPLFLGELVRARLAGLPDGLSGQLIDLVGARLAGLSERARALMDYICVGEPLLATFVFVDDGALAELEQAGLAVTVVESDEHVVRSAHPVYGEVVRAGLSTTSRRLVARRLADSMLGLERRRGDALRLAGWLLDVGELPEPELAREAALEASARLQNDLAERLIEIALAGEESYAALLVAGSLRRNTGDVRTAERRYLAALEAAPGDAERFEAALTLAQLYGYYDGNPDAAAGVLAKVADVVEDDRQRRELAVEGAVFASLGQYDAVIATAEQLLTDPDRDDRAEWAALTTALWAEVQLMRLDKVDHRLARIEALAPTAVNDRPGAVDLVWGLAVTVHLERGDLPGAVAVAEAKAADADRLRVPGGLVRFALGHVQWLRGDVAAARPAVDRAVETLRRFDAFNTLPLVKASAAILAVVDGDEAAAQRLLAADDADRTPTGENPVGTVWQERARGWMLATMDPAAAVGAFVEAARLGRISSTNAWALLALHDAALFDGASAALHELEVLGRLPAGAPFMSLLAEHITARADGAVERVRDCARRFEQAGAGWYAANAWQAVARAETSATAAARAATRATLLAPSAALTLHAAEIGELALSPRQREIAVLAAAGTPSRAIAASAFVSTRTVDNHLRTVYRRLGVDGRAELAAVLGPAVPPVPAAE